MKKLNSGLLVLFLLTTIYAFINNYLVSGKSVHSNTAGTIPAGTNNVG